MSPLAISLRFLQTQPDQRLVELARAGHERAFEALVRRYRAPLLAYCRRIAPRGTPPEDILQQGLLLAWRALRDGAAVRDPRSWLYRIVHNVAVSAGRSRSELAEGVLDEPGSPAVDQLVEQRMAARDALAGLAGLPDLQRQVMVSAALDGRSHDEIAAALGLSSGSVRGLIYRARSTLRAAAAALIPAPVIEWASGEAGSASAGLAGAGSAGLGALILKGSAVLAVGAAAGTAGIVFGHGAGHPRLERSVAALPGGTAHSGPHPISTAQSTGANTRLAAVVASAASGAPAATAGHASQERRRGGRSEAVGGSHTGDSSGDGHGSPQVSGDGGSRGDAGGSGGGSDRGGSAGGSSHGSDGGGEGTAIAASQFDGGDDHGTTITPSATRGRGSSGSSDGGGPSGGGTSSGGGSDGGGPSGGSDGGSDGGPSSTATSATATTTTASPVVAAAPTDITDH